MNADGICPRVNAQYLKPYTESVVRLIGRVTQVNGDTAILDAAGSVTVHSTRDLVFTEGQIFEITGRVNADLSVKALDGINHGSDGNMDNVNKMVELVQRHKAFYYNI
ncbi:replication factor A protein 3 [Kockiozyma suomiensis]|uniref:replication factor A protein 3 n=1 Tax=Kockiozyma suomiensis TaxID=1337062 RepID=UPI003343600B